MTTFPNVKVTLPSDCVPSKRIKQHSVYCTQVLAFYQITKSFGVFFFRLQVSKHGFIWAFRKFYELTRKQKIIPRLSC